MAKYPMAGHSYIEVDDAEGVPRNLSPYIEGIEPVGRLVSYVEVTGLNDPAQRVAAGVELAQEFSLYGVFDDTPLVGPDATLSGLVGKVSVISYGPAGRRVGQRKIAGEFLCLGYQITGGRVNSTGSDPIDGLVRFVARFRQSGPVAIGRWD